MKFLVDAHLPFRIAQLLSSKGHDASHTSKLPNGNNTKDSEIISISLFEKRVVISKDNDFFYSFILFNKPYKLVLLRTGNLRANETIALFEKNCIEMLKLLKNNFLIEMHKDKLFVIK